MPRTYTDFTGQIINGIKVIEVDHNSGGAGRHKRWICECPVCFEKFTIQSNHLKEGNIKMCAKCSRIQREDLTGQKFNHLLVNKMINPGKYKRTICLCTCDCGQSNIMVETRHLKYGAVKSCGCLKSSGEEIIAKILRDNNIIFEKQKTFPGLRYKNPLHCDFYLPDFNLVIEYNGEQHYKPVKLWGGEEELQIIQLRDKIKKDYCLEHNINYLIIKYNENILEALIKNNIIKRDSQASMKIEE